MGSGVTVHAQTQLCQLPLLVCFGCLGFPSCHRDSTDVRCIGIP